MLFVHFCQIWPKKPLNLTKLGALNQIQKTSYLGDRLRYFQNLNCFKLHSPGQINLNSSIIVIENIKISCDPVYSIIHLLFLCRGGIL